MSVNGCASGINSKINFCDFDGIKKKELERRKKLRLEQVCLFNSIPYTQFHSVTHVLLFDPFPIVIHHRNISCIYIVQFSYHHCSRKSSYDNNIMGMY